MLLYMYLILSAGRHKHKNPTTLSLYHNLRLKSSLDLNVINVHGVSDAIESIR